MAVGPVGQIHISVTDLDRAVEFYQDVLGVPLLFRVPGQEMAFFQSGDVRLYLGAPETPEFRSNALIYFTVEDIDAEYARLVARGVDIAEPPHLVHRAGDHELWMTFFRGPEGQNLALMQERPCPS